uniref:Beta-lactamase-related domain-containing protein n=1 Tax=Panagrolaimus davidi TaxID=227884 RepID=A0A914PPS7_9BILA
MIRVENFAKNWERDGAALAVYYKGKPVVDLWGGFADLASERKWKEDTMSIAFSSTKAVGALCIALLIDRGNLQFNEKLVNFWPEFGKYGKDVITVEMIMAHTAGLAHLDEPITFEDAQNHERMSEIIENQKPHWNPGEKTGYHAVAYGWIVDQIVRRVDPKKRSIGTFFREEIAVPNDIEFYIGLPLEMAHRVARLSRTTPWQRFDEILSNPKAIDYMHIANDMINKGFLYKMGQNPTWLQSVFKMTLNNPDLYTLEQPAALGIGTARAMAKLFDLLMKGKIVSPEMVKKLSIPFKCDFDIVTGVTLPRGHGLTYVSEIRGNDTFTLIGHAGLGGQNVRYDVENQLSFGYLSNGLKNGFGNSARTYVPLKNAIYDSIVKFRESDSSSSTLQ